MVCRISMACLNVSWFQCQDFECAGMIMLLVIVSVFIFAQGFKATTLLLWVAIILSRLKPDFFLD